VTFEGLAVPLEDWSNGACDATKASSPDLVPASVTTLGGWSVGRLGPVYFLRSARSAAIKTIVLLDPGSKANMEGGACDSKLKNPTVGESLANWLGGDKSRRLLVFTGHDTEQHPYLGRWGRPRFDGLWHYYLPNIWNKPFADRALICDYDNLGHEDVLRKFAWTVDRPPANCPNAPGAPPPTAWHP
jgi:hypothetical protein